MVLKCAAFKLLLIALFFYALKVTKRDLKNPSKFLKFSEISRKSDE